jgi:DNA-directed RNA polymerase sigma subunit (sigma70/sigma32)
MYRGDVVWNAWKAFYDGLEARYGLEAFEQSLREQPELLTDRERAVIEARLAVPRETRVTIGARIGLSRERVRQIEQRARAKLHRHSSQKLCFSVMTACAGRIYEMHRSVAQRRHG